MIQDFRFASKQKLRIGSGMDWPVGTFGWIPEGPAAWSRLHEVEKTLHSEWGEICNVYMKELTLKLWIYQTFAGVFNISVFRFMTSRSHGPAEPHCALAENFRRSAPALDIKHMHIKITYAINLHWPWLCKQYLHILLKLNKILTIVETIYMKMMTKNIDGVFPCQR